MQTLAYALGIAEDLLVPISLFLLAGALLVPSRRRAKRAIVLALVLAVTVAQPFGIVARPVSGPPDGAKPIGTTAIHVARLFGTVPILPFALYREEFLGPVGDQAPTAAVKARSWFWLPILTNATKIKDICGNEDPCWGTIANSESGPSNALTLEEKNGRYYATLNGAPTTRPGAPSSYTWELGPGIASIAGLIYWALLALLLPAILTRSRSAAAQAMPIIDDGPAA
jgi:hypothetical protein